MGSLSVAVRRVAPGLFSRSPIDVRQEPFTGAVRAASVSLYQTGFGNAPVVFPSFDGPRSAQRSNVEEVQINPMLWGVVWRVAFRMGSIPLKVYTLGAAKAGRRQRQEASEHPAYKLLRAPNPDLTRSHLISGTVFSMFVHHRVGWLKERRDLFGPKIPSNPIIALWPIPGNALFPMRTDKRLLTGYKLRVLGYPEITLDPRDVCFFRLMPDPMDWASGTGPLQPLATAAEFGNAAMTAMTRLFRSALLQKLWIDLHGDELEGENAARMRDELQQAALAGGIPIMEGGATLETVGEGPNHELLSKTVGIVEGIVRNAFGMPTDPDNLQMFYSEVVQPIADVIETELERTLMPDFRDEAFPQFQFREILAGNPLQRAQLHQTKILSGQETPNEARDAEDLGPEDGGDQLFVPLNLVPILSSAQDRNPQPKDSAGGLGGTEGKGTTVKIAPVLTGGKQKIKAAASSEDAQAKSRAEANWRHARSRAIQGQALALERRMRQVVKNELDQMRELIAAKGSAPGDEPVETQPFVQRSEQVVRTSDAQIRQLLGGFMEQVALEGAQLASDLLRGTDSQEQMTPSDDIRALVAARADDMTEHFSTRRVERVGELAEDGIAAKKLDRRLRDAWKVLADHFSKMIGETETAWAFERAAADGWAQMGIQELAMVKSEGDCTTGMCLEVLAQGRFRTTEVPTPLHPGCNCLVLPAPLVE